MIITENHTRLTRSKHRCLWISRRRSAGKPRRIDSSSTPRVASHLYCTKRSTRRFRSSGSWRCLIHSLVSLCLSLHSSNLTVIDCRYVYIGEVRKQSQKIMSRSLELLNHLQQVNNKFQITILTTSNNLKVYMKHQQEGYKTMISTFFFLTTMTLKYHAS